jgi:phosphosulfolactate phosphohydrolase-like enzyme
VSGLRVERFAIGPERTELAELTVVFDVLRATSSAAVLVHRGAALRVVETPALLRAMTAPKPGEYLLVSELGVDHAGARIDNSPVAAQNVQLGGHTPVLVTTNGTRALLAAAARSRAVMAASFLNLSATYMHILHTAPARVTLLPAGDFASGLPHYEDEQCAAALTAMLAGESPNLTALAASCRGDARIQRRLAHEPELANDLDLSFTPDRCPVAMRFVTDAPGMGWIRACESP